MASGVYDKGREAFLNGEIGFNNNTIKCMMLSNAHTLDLSGDEFLANVDAEQFNSEAAQTISSKTVTAGVADGGNITFTDVEASGSYQVGYLAIYQDSGDNTTSPLICIIDSDATGLPVTPNGGSITVEWDDGSNKIFKL